MSNFNGKPEFIQVRVDPNERKVPVSVSFNPTKYMLVNQTLQMGSFSAKIDRIITEWLEIKSILVAYEDDTQREIGQPTVCNRWAERVFSFSEESRGWHLEGNRYEEDIKEIMKDIGYVFPAYPRSQKTIQSKILPVLRERGFIVQVIDEIEYDLFDVWICGSDFVFGAERCSSCPVLNQISNFVVDMKKHVDCID